MELEHQTRAVRIALCAIFTLPTKKLSVMRGQSSSFRQGERVSQCCAVSLTNAARVEENAISKQLKSLDTEAPAKVNNSALVLAPCDVALCMSNV